MKRGNMEFSNSAKWIWSGDDGKKEWNMFRKMVTVLDHFTDVRLLVTAGCYHETYINGTLLVRGPGMSYDFAKYYDDIDVTSSLTGEKEIVIAILSAGFARKGVIAELVLHTEGKEPAVVSTNATWLIRRHDSFKTDMPLTITDGKCEEYFDSRLELIDWNLPEFDDSNWEHAREIGPVGTPPWTGMERSTIGLLANEPVFSKSFSAIELAVARPGYRFRLAASSQFARMFITQIFAKKRTAVSILINDSCPIFSSVPVVSINGKTVDISTKCVIKEGFNLVCFYQKPILSSEMEFLIETEEELVLSANSFLKGVNAQWAVFNFPAIVIHYPWHDASSDLSGDTSNPKTIDPEISQILEVENACDLPYEILKGLMPAMIKEPGIFHIVATQYFYKVKGGFTSPAIEKASPRIKADDDLLMPLIHPENLLHRGCGGSVINPQKGKDIHFIVDFEMEQIGYVEFSLDAPEGTVIDVQCFEVIDGGGIEWMPNYNGFRYICREGRQTFISHSKRGFRYVSVTLRNFRRPILFDYICCIDSRYPVQKTGDFLCSDPLLNQIYKMSVDTASLCMLDTYIDCPGHEQAFWVGDARITALINLLTFGGYDLNQRCIRLAGQSLSPEWAKTYYRCDERYKSGNYLPIAAFPDYPEGGLPMWTFMWILQCREHYLYGGNKKDLEENFGYVKETIKRCKRMTNKRGLFELPGAWNLIEWGNNDLSPYGEVTANNVLLVACLNAAAEMAGYLNHEDLTEEYETEAINRIAAINKFCWDNTQNAYVDTVRDEWAYENYLDFCETKGIAPDSWERYRSCARISEQSNTLAYLCDCVPQERKQKVEKIIERVKNGKYIYGAPSGRSDGMPDEREAPDGIVAIGSPFFLFFSLAALFKMRETDIALNLIRRDWGKMLEKGTATCWETFMMKASYWTRSLCHAWSASPAVYLPSKVLGASPVEPGYRKFVIEPCTGDLEWAKGAVATPYGPIHVSWNRNADGSVNIECSAPDECERVL